MRRLVQALADTWAERTVQRHSRVSIGRNTKLRWWRLRSLRGGRLSIGCDSIVHCRIDFDSEGANVRIGSRCYLGASHLVCHTAIDVGDDVIMSWGVTIVDHDSHSPHWHERQHDVGDWMQGRKRWDAIRIAPVIIEAKVWIGFGAAILRGVTIGEGAVVGACSVVTRDVPPYTVVAGNPARVVRRLDLPQA